MEGGDESEAELVWKAASGQAADAEKVPKKLAGEGLKAELWMQGPEEGEAVLQLIVPGGGGG